MFLASLTSNYEPEERNRIFGEAHFTLVEGEARGNIQIAVIANGRLNSSSPLWR